jgi:hypothetical protein
MVAVARPRVLVVVPMLAALAFGASPALAGGRSGGVAAGGTGGHGLPFVGIPLLALLGVGVAVVGVGLALLAGERRRRSGRQAA